jgi:antitoxin component YwqK of YwqJK toxin-antitoxin module
MQGNLEIHCQNGMLLQSTSYDQGHKEGKSLRYWSEDLIASSEEYSDGLLISGCYYDLEGKEISTVKDGNGIRSIFGKETAAEMQEYKFGQPEGKCQIFDPYGRIVNYYHVKNVCKHGEETSYYDAVRLQPNLTPKLMINWYEGKIQGVCKTWYQNGIQESQKEMSNNKKNGHHTIWYRDGSLMMIEQYEQDKLMRGEYYQRGEKSPISTIIDGTGCVTLYDADGNFNQKVEYHRGKPDQ